MLQPTLARQLLEGRVVLSQREVLDVMRERRASCEVRRLCMPLYATQCGTYRTHDIGILLPSTTEACAVNKLRLVLSLAHTSAACICLSPQ